MNEQARPKAIARRITRPRKARPIEVLIPGDKPCWEFSRVEATEDGRYFIVGHGDLEMAGLQTRYRE